MCLLLESVRFEHGKFHNVASHQDRMNYSVRKLLNSKAPRLEKILNDVRALFRPQPNQVYKFRILYDTSLQKIEWDTYRKPEINSLKLVETSHIDYAHKYANRENLKALFLQKSSYDDILIVKEGRITDTYFCNVVFFNGKQWLTPAYPLLKGTQRAVLLQQNTIYAADIHVDDLKHFSKVRLINALLPFETAPELNIQQIFS